MAAAEPWNASLLLLGSFNSTPGAEVPQMSQSLCPGKRNLCWLESLGEEREEPLAQGEHSSLAVGKELPQEALCTMREEKATQSHGRNSPACTAAISQDRAVVQEETCLLALGCSLGGSELGAAHRSCLLPFCTISFVPSFTQL